MKNSRRNIKIIQKRRAKKTRMKKPGFKSKYARKKEFLHTQGGFGFDHEVKPWK